MIFTKLLRKLRNRDGFALPVVIGLGLAMTIMVATVLTVSTSGTVKSGTDRDAANAMAAAYAGLADYQSKLTANNAYEKYGVLTSFNTGSTFAGTNGNPAFGTTTGGTWATVANSTASPEYFRYEVDNSSYAASGVIRVRVTGKAGNTTRSIVANLKGTGFIDYLYFTNYESSNPAVTGETQQGNSSKLCVSEHMTDPGYNSNVACQPVQFISGDVLYGPVRTNDEFTICGAEFKQTVQSTASTGTYNKPSGCGNAVFDSGTPQNVASLALPATNSAMLQETRNDLTASTVPRPGCLYTGPTSIVFNGSAGTMTVNSPWTLATQIAINSSGQMSGTSTGAAAAECGTITALHSAAGATVQVPADNLVYVQSVPSSNANGDPNYWASTATPTSPTGVTFCSVTKTSGGKTTTTYGNGLINSNGKTYPATNEFNGPAGASTVYGCRNGDAFVQGQFHGALTIGAQNNLYVTGNITYTDSTNDILGLVGQSTVTVWNPMSCASSTNNVCSTTSGNSTLLNLASGANVTIDAAIASNGGTFQVQNYAYGAKLGTLTVLGSIAQDFRGAVGVNYGGTHQTGFIKSYGYDTRLLNTAPPKFLQPVSTTYGVTTEIEVATAFGPDGTPLT